MQITFVSACPIPPRPRSSPFFSRVSSAIHCTGVDGIIKTATKPLPVTALPADASVIRPPRPLNEPN
ncbi:hypothetical protein D6D08_05768 [Aureobasidium pullulans]|nr:hypothetical protein D6D08_05768 [Aureobasidium pullulans]